MNYNKIEQKLIHQNRINKPKENRQENTHETDTCSRTQQSHKNTKLGDNVYVW